MSKMDPKFRIRRKHRAFLKRWMPHDKDKLFRIILEDVEQFEVPTAQIYYRDIIQNYPEFTDYGWVSMRDKLRNSRLKYMKATEWKRIEGDELDDPEKSREYMLKICPDFDILDIIFGSRNSFLKREPIDVYDHEVSNQRIDNSINIEPIAVYDHEISNQGIENNIKIEPIEVDVHEISKQPIETNSMAFLAKAELSNKTINNLDNVDRKPIKDMDQAKLQLERDKLELEKEKLRREFKLKEIELQNNFQIQKLKLLQEKELKMVELKFKYKDLMNKLI